MKKKLFFICNIINIHPQKEGLDPWPVTIMVAPVVAHIHPTFHPVPLSAAVVVDRPIRLPLSSLGVLLLPLPTPSDGVLPRTPLGRSRRSNGVRNLPCSRSAGRIRLPPAGNLGPMHADGMAWMFWTRSMLP